MSYTTVGVENALRKWSQTITGTPFYFTDTSAARPSGLYGMIRFVSVQILGTPSQEFTPVTISGNPMVQNELNDKSVMVCRVDAYRTGARDVISTLKQGAYLTLPNEILQNANIGFVKFSTMLDLTQVIEANYEERAQIDVTFNLVGYASEVLNTITTIPIDNLSYGLTSEVVT